MFAFANLYDILHLGGVSVREFEIDIVALKAYIKEKYRTQGAFAALSGIPAPRLSLILTGKVKPGSKAILALLRLKLDRRGIFLPSRFDKSKK
jgi:hypothetical protein